MVVCLVMFWEDAAEGEEEVVCCVGGCGGGCHGDGYELEAVVYDFAHAFLEFGVVVVNVRLAVGVDELLDGIIGGH